MISHERLLEVLDYSLDTGEFRWKVRRCGKAMPGNLTGCPDGDGYKRIYVDGRLYKSHRLAWFYVTGKWPTQQIDHIDTDRKNNAFLNLREASNSENQMNRSLGSNNKTGIKGVCWYRASKKWRAKIRKQGREYIKYFDDIRQAAEWVSWMREQLHGEFANSGTQS